MINCANLRDHFFLDREFLSFDSFLSCSIQTLISSFGSREEPSLYPGSQIMQTQKREAVLNFLFFSLLSFSEFSQFKGCLSIWNYSTILQVFFFSENVRPYKATGMETLCLFYNLFKTPFSPKFTKKAFLKHFFFRDKDRWVSTAVYVFLEPRNRTCVSQQRISLLRLKRENIDGTCHDDAPPECRYAPLPLPYLGTSPALGEH